MKARLFICMWMTVFAASPALAAPLAVAKNTGELVFRKANCSNDDAPDEAFDECGCEVKIEYQQIAGNDEINKHLAPDEDVTSYCNALLEASLKQGDDSPRWEAAKPEDFKKAFFQFSSKQEITFQSPEWLDVVSYDYVYSGGAHGNTGLSSTLYDLKTGKEIDFVTLLDLKKVEQVNKDIHQQLTARKADVFPEILKSPAAYVTPDGACNACEYVLKSDGLYAVFQQYAVGPYSSGFIEVKLPTTFLNQPIITMAKGS